jgi:hypothetical protein
LAAKILGGSGVGAGFSNAHPAPPAASSDSTSAADVRRLMNGERAILFATDPPYLVDYDGSNHPTRNSLTGLS